MSKHQKLKYSKDYSKCCPICLAQVRGRQEKRLPCQHILHKKCFERLQSKGHWRCPNCRRPFTKRSKTCSYEVKADSILDDLDEGRYNSSSESLHRRPYWDNLSFLPPLTPPGSDSGLGEERQTRRERELDSPQRSRSFSRRERESPCIRREREDPCDRMTRDSTDRRRRARREPREESHTRYRDEDSKESDDEYYEQVVENFTDEPFFRFFSSNLLHEHEQREGLSWRRSRRVSPDAARRSDRRE